MEVSGRKGPPESAGKCNNAGHQLHPNKNGGKRDAARSKRCPSSFGGSGGNRATSCNPALCV